MMQIKSRVQVSAASRPASVVGLSARPSRRSALRASASQSQRAEVAADDATSRRQLLAGLSLAVASSMLTPSMALAEGEAAEVAPYKIFYGLASPPTSYGGYGGNAKEAAKYTFEYPSDWREEVPSKVEKGTQGIDGRVQAPKVKDLRAFVITLGRAGEDNKTFILRDTESTFAGFAGADYNLQDALTSATNVEKTSKNVEGIDFYDFDIDSPDFRYLASIAVKGGKVFALFVRCPARLFKTNETKLRHMLDTFRLL